MRVTVFDVHVLIAVIAVGAVKTVRAELVTALTQTNQLVSFDSATPGATSVRAISGLQGGDFLSAFDARPANKSLFGLAVNGTTGRLYNINRNTGQATLASTIRTPLIGSFFGVDFNPAVDRLRIVSNLGQNLRINVDTGETTVDTALQYAAGDRNAGAPPLVIASAYSNNTAGTAATTLYGLDLNTQSLVTQAPPNNGTLNTIGSLSSILFPEAAFDISGVTGVAYAILNGFELATVNLTTGATATIGAINAPSNLIGLSVQPTAIPEPGSGMLVLCGAAAWYVLRCRRCRVRQQADLADDPGTQTQHDQRQSASQA